MMKCACMHPAPFVMSGRFADTYAVNCKGCGGDLSHKAGPRSEHKLAAEVGYEFERRGNSFLSVSECQWLRDRHQFLDETAEATRNVALATPDVASPTTA